MYTNAMNQMILIKLLALAGNGEPFGLACFGFYIKRLIEPQACFS